MGKTAKSFRSARLRVSAARKAVLAKTDHPKATNTKMKRTPKLQGVILNNQIIKSFSTETSTKGSRQ